MNLTYFKFSYKYNGKYRDMQRNTEKVMMGAIRQMAVMKLIFFKI